MLTRGIRGAITVDNNTVEDIEKATVELIRSIISKNEIKTEDISHVIFTLTSDLNAAFPAKFARTNFDWDFVPMMCFNELDIKNSLSMCLRILIVVNTEKSQKEIHHVYLRGAQKLRPDLNIKNG